MTRIAILAAALFVAAPAFAETAPTTQPTAPAGKMAAEAQRLDINAATVEQLMGVKGLSKPLAEAIVKGRPFRNVDELASKKILSAEVYSSVKTQLFVR